jgi:redox-sensitive bicupin YhaK (pirin superfamily)
MEIITYVISGQLEHQDHLGNRGIVHPGEVQVMSAGKGIFPASATRRRPTGPPAPDWVMPRTMGGTPRWEQKQFTPADRSGKLLRSSRRVTRRQTTRLRSTRTQPFTVSSLKPGESVEHETKPGRLTYLFVIGGTVEAEDGSVTLAGGDSSASPNR